MEKVTERRVMVINKHGSFYLRNSWGTKIIQSIEIDETIFTPANELKAVDNLGLGRVMIKALRYWANSTGLAQEKKAKNAIIEERTELYNLISRYDRYFQKQGSLLLLHRNLSRNKDYATAWYWAFNEFDKMSFSRDEFVEGLHYYLAVNGMTIKKNAVEKEYNCFKNTYIDTGRHDKKTIMDEDTYPLLGPLRILHYNDEKKLEKTSLTKSDIPLPILVYAIAMDNQDDYKNGRQISIDKLLEEKSQIGKYFSIRHSKLIEMLLEAENKGYLSLNNNFGNRYIEFSDIQFDKLLRNYFKR